METNRKWGPQRLPAAFFAIACAALSGFATPAKAQIQGEGESERWLQELTPARESSATGESQRIAKLPKELDSQEPGFTRSTLKETTETSVSEEKAKFNEFSDLKSVPEPREPSLNTEIAEFNESAQVTDLPDPAESSESAEALPAEKSAALPSETPSPPRAVIVPSASTVSCGDKVLLSAQASFPGAEAIVEYQWALGANPNYNDAFGPVFQTPPLSAPIVDGRFSPVEVGLRVRSIDGRSDTTRLSLHLRPKTSNQPPIARLDSRYLYVDKDAQEDVLLDASQSSDPDGECDALQYEWSCETAGERPCNTSSMSLNQPTLRIPWQNLEARTSYFWTLKVSDLAGASDSKQVVIESLQRKDPAAPDIEVTGKKNIDDGLAKDCIYRSKTGEAIWCADW